MKHIRITRTYVDTVHYRIITQSTYPISLLLFWPLLLRLETQDLLILKVSDVPPMLPILV